MRVEEKIFSLFSKLDIETTEDVLWMLTKYVGLWSRWNLHVRLTSKMSEGEFICTQLAESLLLWQLFGRGGRYLDVGSGGGLPGIPISILLRERTVLVESNHKKAAFLNLCKRELDMPWLEVYCGRIEKVAEIRSVAPFRYITARAVASLKDILRWTADLSDDNTVYILPKGDKAEREIDDASSELNRRSLSVRLERLENPFKSHRYQVIVVEKVG